MAPERGLGGGLMAENEESGTTRAKGTAPAKKTAARITVIARLVAPLG
jgi:hypothetical protein